MWLRDNWHWVIIVAGIAIWTFMIVNSLMAPPLSFEEQMINKMNSIYDVSGPGPYCR